MDLSDEHEEEEFEDTARFDDMTAYDGGWGDQPMVMNNFNPYYYPPGYWFAPPESINSSNLDQNLLDASESEDEDEEGSWYKIPSHAVFDEATKVLVLDDVPFTDRILEFMSKGSVKLFRAKVCNKKTLRLIAQSKVYKEFVPTQAQDLSIQESIAHLVESPGVKAEGIWKLPKKGEIVGVFSEKLKESLTVATSKSNLSVSSLQYP